MCNTGCLLGEVIGSFEIFAEKLHFSFNVAREQWLAILIGEFAMNTNRGRPGNSSYFTGHLTALLKASHGAVQNNEVRNARGISVAFAIDVPEAALLL